MPTWAVQFLNTEFPQWNDMRDFDSLDEAVDYLFMCIGRGFNSISREYRIVHMTGYTIIFN